MTSPIDMHTGPAAGFDEPFEMLDACHQRVERMLQLLERLSTHLAGHGADPQAQQAATDVMRYFDLAAPLHHEDEERHLLPQLRAQGRGAQADRVLHEHQAMVVGWAGVRAHLPAVAQGRWVATSGTTATAWADFASLYREHIAFEERDVFVPVRAQIGAECLRAMGHEMARRRGVR